MRLIFLGAPGAGKGTQAKGICRRLNIPHISTGDILREAVSNQTEVGLRAKEYMDKGDLVPDEVVIDIVSERLAQNDCSKGFLLDGFPRTVNQASVLNEKLESLELKIDNVIYFSVIEEQLIKRITGRRLCKECGDDYHIESKPSKQEGICDKCKGQLYQRKDDTLETIKNRLKVFMEQSAPLIDYYKDKELLKEIVSNVGIDEVLKKVLEALSLTK